jgi:hypothetical protein
MLTSDNLQITCNVNNKRNKHEIQLLYLQMCDYVAKLKLTSDVNKKKLKVMTFNPNPR